MLSLSSKILIFSENFKALCLLWPVFLSLIFGSLKGPCSVSEAFFKATYQIYIITPPVFLGRDFLEDSADSLEP